MNTDVTKFENDIYQIDVHMEGKPQRMSCYYIDSPEPILIEVGPSNSFPYLISALESIGINNIERTAITHLHLDHVGGIGHLNEKYKENFVYVHELGLKHLPNPERLWRAVSDVYTEEWLKKNWGEIKPIPLENIKSLNDGADIKLDKNRNLKALYSPGHAKHHYTFYDEYSGTLFMGDTLGLIYPHGDFVQPNLPPPDFDKKILFESLDNIEKLDLNQLAIAHFGIHKNPYKLIRNAKESINNWIDFINKLPNLSDKKASEELVNWIKTNYQSLGIDEVTINNYVGTGNFEMQINGVRTFLNNRIL
jgi:glyoxylase-like metal-dependent hydrolase (beta-lactamase superfamily II)|tara:strand:+ start:608 stop:1528 length:921 start_codon:yes stop_codon:yes gene_type:complete